MKETYDSRERHLCYYLDIVWKEEVLGIGWLICLSGGKTIYRCPHRRREDGPVGEPVSGCWKWKGRDMFSPGYHSSGKSESTRGVDISSIYTT